MTSKYMCEIIIIDVLLSLIILLQFCILINSNDIKYSGRRMLYASSEPKLRMQHGNQASVYEYTFMAVLVKYITKIGNKTRAEAQGRLICGGAIIHKDWVLTSARCFDINLELEELTQYEIYAGVVEIGKEVGQQTRTIEKVSVHPNFKPASDEFNIAMIKVSSSFRMTSYVREGLLPVEPFRVSGIEGCHMLGFVREHDGVLVEDRLIKVKLHAIDYTECLDRLKILKLEKPFDLSEKNYCLVQIDDFPHNGSQGACEGDVGGPCICGFRIQGLISHYTNKTCYNSEYPTTITDVGQHLNWIRSNILQLNIVPRNFGIISANLRFPLILFYFTFLLLKQLK